MPFLYLALVLILSEDLAHVSYILLKIRRYEGGSRFVDTLKILLSFTICHIVG